MNKKSYALVITVGLLIIVLLAGCYPGELSAEVVEAASSSPNSTLNMAARIEFHDQLWEQRLGTTAVNEFTAKDVVDMASRIEFHDQLWAQQLGATAVDESLAAEGATMADRIHFQDQLWENGSADEVTQAGAGGEMSLVERILFHDKLWEQSQ